jgi:hypothetical protein
MTSRLSKLWTKLKGSRNAKAVGIAAFLFFFIKGLFWIALVVFGLSMC